MDAINTLTTKFTSWFDGFVDMLPNILLAIVVILVFIGLAMLTKRLILKFLLRFASNKAVVRLLSNILTVVVVLVGLFIALEILHLEKTVTSLLAGAGVAGLAVGLAFQDPLLNVISGVLLTTRSMPFTIGDLVRTNGYYGNVHSITLRSTIIKTLDGDDVIIPNKMVLQNPIDNVSFEKDRRVEISCGVAYNSDLEKVKKITLESIEKLNYDRNREVEFYYTEFGGSSINFIYRFWITESNEMDFLSAQSTAIIELKKHFDAEGINIPFPIRTLDFRPNDLTMLSGQSNDSERK